MKLHRLLVAALAIAALPTVLPAQDNSGVEFFEKRIRPVLVEHCYQCHSALAKELKGGLLVDSRDAMRRGGDSGPAVVPGSIADSLLIAAIRHESLEMPPDEKLPDVVISDFERWISEGAVDPRDEPATAEARLQAAQQAQYGQLRQWWSLQPIVQPPIPQVKNQQWSAQPIDRFVLQQLEQHGLEPVAGADRLTLARRVNFALIGLPPSSEQMRQLLEDASPDAWPHHVDRLLDSPHFGERWARHWMDVVRYSDTYGYEWDIPAKGAWRYRDYLIRALNADVPIDQLIREQIAGDLLDEPRVNRIEHINESLIGTMFFQMGEKRHGDSSEFDGIHQEMMDNKIDAFSKAFQAQTIACARCHDHKLDPVLQSEYYALGGVLMSSRWVSNTLDTRDRNASTFARLREIKAQLRQQLAALWLEELEQLPTVMQASLSGAAPADQPHQTWQDVHNADKPLTLEDVRYSWSRAVQKHKQQEDVTADWRSVAEEYRTQHQQRLQQNAADCTVIADLRSGLPAGWSVDGVGLQDVAACGDYVVSLDGERAIGRLLPGGLFTHALSPRLNGALRSPYLDQFEKAFLTFEYCGGEFSTHRTVIDNAFLTEKQVYLNQPAMDWLRLSTYPSMRQRRIYIELATKTSNPNFPPRVGLGGACSEEQVRDPRSWFGVTRILLHDKEAAPVDELTRFQSLFDDEAPANLSEVAARYRAWFERSLMAWSQNTATEFDVQLINWLIDQGQLTNSCKVTTRPEIANLVMQYRELEKQILEPQTVNGMAEVDAGYDLPLNVRGEYDQPGDNVPRGYCKALGTDHEPFSGRGSGRRELAEIIASSQNPLTARVFVNRVWHWLFGAGIVRTPNDFGHAGATPSHPELLDYLASRFIAEGWSLKKLVREIVLSETWQQSGSASERAMQIDPENRLLHHFPLQRLEAELIRDAVLAVSGRLDKQLFGPPTDPPRQNEDPQKRLFSGPLDGNGRRSIYTKLTIMEPPRFLALFNQPPPKISVGARDVTNTPAQSLALLNDPFVMQQSEYWATRLIATPHSSVSKRIDEMFQSALGRPPTQEEQEDWSALISDLAELHYVSADRILMSVEIWANVAHTFFNTKEFIYVR